VEDNGKGFNENTISKLFDKFYRLNQYPKNGIGLGLSIVKGFVEAHDGNIVAANKQSGGASFTITIPAIHMH